MKTRDTLQKNTGYETENQNQLQVLIYYEQSVCGTEALTGGPQIILVVLKSSRWSSRLSWWAPAKKKNGVKLVACQVIIELGYLL